MTKPDHLPKDLQKHYVELTQQRHDALNRAWHLLQCSMNANKPPRASYGRPFKKQSRLGKSGMNIKHGNRHNPHGSKRGKSNEKEKKYV